MLSKSTFRLTSTQSAELNSWIYGDMCKNNQLIKLYVDCVRSHVIDLVSLSSAGETCILSSGLFCFLGQIMLCVCQSSKNVPLDIITHFTLLYL